MTNSYPHRLEDSPFTVSFRDAVLYMHVGLIVMGNLGTVCVMVVFIWDRTLWKPSYFFVGFLALIDTLHLTIVGSIKIQFLQNGSHWRWASGARCWWVGFATLHLMLSTTLISVLIAINRFVRVFYSNVQYQKCFRVHLVALMCLAVIVIAGLWSVCADVQFHPNIPVCFLDAKQSRMRVSLLLGQYALSYSVVVFLYGSIIKKLAILNRKLRIARTSRVNPALVITKNTPMPSKNSNPKIPPPYRPSTQLYKERNRVADKGSTSLCHTNSQSSAYPFGSLDYSERRGDSVSRPQLFESGILENTDDRPRTFNIESAKESFQGNEDPLTHERCYDKRKQNEICLIERKEHPQKRKSIASISFANDEQNTHRTPGESSGHLSIQDMQWCFPKSQSKIPALPPQRQIKAPSSSSCLLSLVTSNSLLQRPASSRCVLVRMNVFSRKPHTKRSVDNLKFGFVFYTLNIMTCIPFWVCFVVQEWYQLEISSDIMPFSHFLILCGSAFNPLVYGMMNKSFQKSGQRLWHKLLGKNMNRQNDSQPAKMANYSEATAG